MLLLKLMILLKIFQNVKFSNASRRYSKQCDKNSLDVVNLAIKYGFKYSDRLHIRLWDNKEEFNLIKILL